MSTLREAVDLHNLQMTGHMLLHVSVSARGGVIGVECSAA